MMQWALYLLNIDVACTDIKKAVYLANYLSVVQQCELKLLDDEDDVKSLNI